MPPAGRTIPTGRRRPLSVVQVVQGLEDPLLRHKNRPMCFGLDNKSSKEQVLWKTNARDTTLLHIHVNHTVTINLLHLCKLAV